MFKYGNCIDDEREMMVDGDVLWLIIFDKYCWMDFFLWLVFYNLKSV